MSFLAVLWSSFLTSAAWAQQAGAPGGAGGPSLVEQLIPFIVLFVVLWFLMIRPQQKRMKIHQEFLSKLKRGDEVLTQSGIFGTVEGLTDRFVTLEIADGVKVRVVKSQVAGLAKEEAPK